MEMGKTNEVEKLLKSAYDIDKKKLGEKNPATVAVQQELANYYRELCFVHDQPGFIRESSRAGR